MSEIRPLPTAPGSDIPAHVAAIVDQLDEIVVGKRRKLELALACLLARGHLLIEDVPGVGKTILAHALARTLGLDFQRIQFTSDLLPADVIGVSIYERETSQFRFHPGPIFSQLVLADEVNRATPKTQSALLEAMEERQVTADGHTHTLPEPFFVIATQNPSYQVGTFPLPESQLDRFLMRIELGYPSPDVERQLLTGADRQQMLKTLPSAVSRTELASMQKAVSKIHAAPALLDYVQALVAFTREDGALMSGLSPRAAIQLLRAAQAWALMAGNSAVIPEHVQAVAPAIISHRVRWRDDARAKPNTPTGVYVVSSVPVP